MKRLRAAIVDDEPLARTRMRRLLQKVAAREIEVVGECVDADELLRLAGECELDVLFLDICMPECSGFQALARWNGPLPRVVFVTADPMQGLQAFDVNAVDYLLKPVGEARLAETVRRLRAMDGAAASDPPAAEAQPGARLPLRVGRRTDLVPVERIDLVQAHRNYIEVSTAESRYVLRQSLQAFIAQLDPEQFLRVHRSAVVRRDAVRGLKPIGSACYLIDLGHGRRLRSGRAYADVLRALLRE